MDIKISEDGSSIAAMLDGPITEADGESLRLTFEKLVNSNRQEVRLDLSLVPIMTSAGIGKLIILHKNLRAQKRVLVIDGIHEDLYGMFSSINLDKVFTLNR